MKMSKISLVVFINYVFISALGAESPTTENQGYLGIHVQKLNQPEKTALNISDGVLVTEVEEGSPAEDADIRSGDVILRIDEKTVRSAKQLKNMIRDYKPETRIKITLLRALKEEEIVASLGKKEISEIFWYDKNNPKMRIISGKRAYLGVRLEPLTPDLAEYFKRPESGGALILEVLKESPAEKSGLKAGDVILTIERESIKTPEDVIQILREFESGESIQIEVIRHGHSQTFSVTLDEQSVGNYHWFSGSGEQEHPFHMKIPEFEHFDFKEFDSEDWQEQFQDLDDQIILKQGKGTI